MAAVAGRRVPMPLPRVWVSDLLAAARGVPIITIERRMRLAPVAAARAGSALRVPWPLLFAKAFAVAAADRPELRRSYVRWPRPHLFEADESVVSVAVEREYAGEPAVFFGLLTAPDRQPLAALCRTLADWRTKPVERVRPFAKLLRYSRLPLPARRLAWLIGLQSSGRRRAKHLGTVGLSVTASAGATCRNLISPLAFTLNYGVFGPAHELDVRLHFDHRVLDGMPAARALAAVEEALNGPLAAELRASAASGVKAVDVLTAVSS